MQYHLFINVLTTPQLGEIEGQFLAEYSWYLIQSDSFF